MSSFRHARLLFSHARESTRVVSPHPQAFLLLPAAIARCRRDTWDSALSRHVAKRSFAKLRHRQAGNQARHDTSNPTQGNDPGQSRATEAVGFWNFLGAGVFGFLINLPIISYYEVGTILTPNHGHAAMMGVFGMLAIALMVFVLRQTSHDAHWPGIEKYIKVSFWGTNLGLLMMVALSLFPGGVLQVWDVVQHGYWHARSLACTGPAARA